MTVKIKTEDGEITAESGIDLMKALADAGYHVPSFCGGRGTCGKCTVEIVEDGKSSCVKACQYTVEKDICVMISKAGSEALNTEPSVSVQGPKPFAVFDLGTTGVAAAAYDGDSVKEISRVNVLSRYGADIISRASHIHDNNSLDVMTRELREQVTGMLEEVCGTFRPDTVLIGGNTVMQHIFAGIDPFPITVSPFAPSTLFLSESETVYLGGLKTVLTPCVAGYFGGDLVAGLSYILSLENTEKTVLFIDIGTNGEMALINGDSVVCCSVACGPAFEGGNITCGMPGISGAVDHVWLKNGSIAFAVVGDGEPKGLCGSGIIDLVACLLELGIIDSSGRLLSPEESEADPGVRYEEDSDGNGVIYLADKVWIEARDVRMIQMAKAAVAAGISTMLKESGKSCEEIENVYLAGGFGTFMKISSACRVGMIPEKLEKRCVSAGNTCLKGLALASSRSDARKLLLDTSRKCRYIELSGNALFNNEYIDNMIFSED